MLLIGEIDVCVLFLNMMRQSLSLIELLLSFEIILLLNLLFVLYVPHLSKLLLFLAVLVQVSTQVRGYRVVEVFREVRVVDRLFRLVVIPEDIS